MTITLKESIYVPVDPATAFTYTANFSRIEEWDPGVASSKKLSDGAVGVGTESEVVVAFGPRRIPMRYVVTAYQPNEQVVLYGEGGGISGTDTISFVAEGSGTRITYQADLDGIASSSLAKRLIQPVMDRVGRKAVDGLQRALTPPQQPPAPSSWRDLGDRLLIPGAIKFTQRGYKKMKRKAIIERLAGRTVVITGATSGIGEAAAFRLAELGCRLVIIGRSAEKLADTKQRISQHTGHKDIACYQADLSLMSDVRQVAAKLKVEEQGIDVLINNAGALFNELAETSEGHERSLALNLMSHYLLTELLLEPLRTSATATEPSRVVNVASGGMYLQGLKLSDLQNQQGEYDGSKAYARAKRGLVALTQRWAKDEAAAHVIFHAMHPGWVNTPGVEDALPAFHQKMAKYLREPAEGADTIVWLAAASAARFGSGQFWLDRKPHTTEVLPKTKLGTERCNQLVAELDRLTGR